MSDKNPPENKECVFTVGYWMPVKSQRERIEQAKLCLWRWEEGRVDMSDFSWYTTVTAKSPVEAVKKGQLIRAKELANGKNNCEAA